MSGLRRHADVIHFPVVRRSAEQSEHPHAWLLRAHRERPSRRAGEEGDELPSPHGIVPGEPKGCRNNIRPHPKSV
jgi:hypothetical protein